MGPHGKHPRPLHAWWYRESARLWERPYKGPDKRRLRRWTRRLFRREDQQAQHAPEDW